MRYVIQFLIPLLIFAAAVLLLVRKRKPSRQVEPADPADEIMTPRAFISLCGQPIWLQIWNPASSKKLQ